MEDRKLNEKESLELISQMIQNTRKNMELGSGNIMLLWGYISVIAALVVYVGLELTGNHFWNLAWFGIPAVGYPLMMYLYRKRTVRVKTYTDKAIDAVWTIMGISMLAATAFFCLCGQGAMLLPLSLLLVAIGAAMTMAILREGWMQVPCFVAVGIGMYLMSDLVTDNALHFSSVIYFAAGFVLSLIVPAIISTINQESMFKELDPLLHSQLRLAVMSVLMSVEEVDFVYLKEQTQATAGNLSVQLDKLSTAGYICVEKGFVGKKTRTTCRITEAGRAAFVAYVDALKDYLKV